MAIKSVTCFQKLTVLFLPHFSLSFRAGYLPQGVPLQLIGYLPEETSFLPWHSASRALYQLDKLLDRTDEYSLFSVNTQSINYHFSQSVSQSVSQ